jgi:hypothetical protein
MLGFCRTRVSASESSALTVPPEMVTAKLVALVLARVLRVKLEGLEPEPVAPVVVVVPLALVELGLAWGVMPKDWGRVIPRLRILSRLTSRMATSTTTSARVRSRSLISFSARTRCDGGARMTMAFCVGRGQDLVVGGEHVAERGEDVVGVGLPGWRW